jgi:glycosyltransferase involved in cell wall biosynthesis
MIESMACGTPVVATRHGAVPEVVEHGRSGVIVDHWAEAGAALAEADAISPESCRRYAEEWFAPSRMVRDYLAAYETMLEGGIIGAGYE